MPSGYWGLIWGRPRTLTTSIPVRSPVFGMELTTQDSPIPGSRAIPCAPILIRVPEVVQGPGSGGTGNRDTLILARIPLARAHVW